MDHRERFYATINREPVDRPASWLGIPVPGSEKELLRYFKAGNMNELKHKVGDDVYSIELPYHAPGSDAIYTALNFSKKRAPCIEERTLTVPGFFEHETDPSAIVDFDWPDPAKHINPDECKSAADTVPSGYAILGVIWSAHFQDACAAFGMETAFIKMLTEPQMFKAVIDRITDFYLRANEIFYKATRNKLDAVLIGNDFGSQTGLMVSPDMLRKFVFPGTRELIAQAKSYDLKVIYHSCGAVSEIIPDLIQAGADVVHPIQALAVGMDPRRLRRDFGDRVSFCGGVDAQNLLVNGMPEAVRNKVLELKEIFPTGLIISPSHEAILPDIPPANIEALFRAVDE